MDSSPPDTIVDQPPLRDAQTLTLESKTHYRHPSPERIGIEIPSSYIPSSLAAPEFFSYRIGGKFS